MWYGTGAKPYRTGVSDPPVIRTLPPYPLVVDPLSGSDGNTGSASAPLQSLTAAIAACSGLPDWLIRVISRASAPLRVEHIYNSPENLTIEGWGAEPWYVRGSVLGTGWTSEGGGIYSMALSGTQKPFVVVETLTETIGDRSFPLRLLQAGATTTPAAGQSGWSGGRVYVRMPDSSDPALQTVEIMRLNKGLHTYGSGRLTVRNVNGRYYNSSVCLNGLSTQPENTGWLTVEDSEVMFCDIGGIGSTGRNEETVITRVNSWRNGNDGFNFRCPLGGLGKAILYGCDGSYNGNLAGESAQGASAHTTSWMQIYGGTFNYNVSGGMVSIDSSINDLIGNSSWGAILMNHNMRLGNTAGTIAAQASCAWMDNTIGTVSGSVTVSNGQGVGVRVVTPGAVTGISNIISTGNALPDVIA